ncbi:MAG: hypothetical protein V1887_01480 [Candidatus Aenigmatarchaeota archaeon]
MVSWRTEQIYDTERMETGLRELGYLRATVGKDEVRYRRGDFHLIARRKTTHMNFSLHIDVETMSGQSRMVSDDTVKNEYRRLNRLLERLVRL